MFVSGHLHAPTVLPLWKEQQYYWNYALNVVDSVRVCREVSDDDKWRSIIVKDFANCFHVWLVYHCCIIN
jgi:hypothetical protein